MTDSEKLDILLSDMQDMKTEIQELNRRTTSIELRYYIRAVLKKCA